MVGLSLFLVVVVGVVVWLSRHDSTYHAPLDRQSPPKADATAATRLLTRLQAAVRRDDPAAGASLGSSRSAADDLRGVVRNAGATHVVGFSLRYVDEAGAVSPSGTWTADVATTWRFAGFDQRAEHLEVQVRFAAGRGSLGIAGIGGGDRRSPLWLSGPLQVRRTATSMVLVEGSAARADRFAALARHAVPQVRQVLPGWRGGLVVEVPASQDGLDAALGAHRGDYAGIAAVTTTVDGSRSRRSPSHVFINPPVFDPLQTRGAQVVITHETTHVATDAANSTAPTWLIEGFADFVALSAQPLPVSTTAARIAALVHRHGVPGALPSEAQFAPGSPYLEARYESAWLACRLLAEDAGTPSLVGFYRAMDAGGRLGPELERYFGFGLPAFVRQWQDVLRHLPA
ncbi:MAG: hypothetical protein QM747_18510 [Nocardioides sp.]